MNLSSLNYLYLHGDFFHEVSVDIQTQLQKKLKFLKTILDPLYSPIFIQKDE